MSDEMKRIAEEYAKECAKNMHKSGWLAIK